MAERKGSYDPTASDAEMAWNLRFLDLIVCGRPVWKALMCRQAPPDLLGHARRSPSLAAKLGRRPVKSLGTDNKAQADRLANILWLHDWKRKLAGEQAEVAQDKEALFFRELIRNAKADEDGRRLNGMMEPSPAATSPLPEQQGAAYNGQSSRWPNHPIIG